MDLDQNQNNQNQNEPTNLASPEPSELVQNSSTAAPDEATDTPSSSPSMEAVETESSSLSSSAGSSADPSPSPKPEPSVSPSSGLAGSAAGMAGVTPQQAMPSEASPSTNTPPHTPGILPPVQPASPAGAGGGGVVGDFGSSPAAPGASPFSPAPKKRRKKLLITIIVIIIVLLAGAAAYYFGYYTNGSLLYGQSLSDTATAYNRLIDYANDQAKANYKGVTGSGSYKVVDGTLTTDGKLSFKGSGGNSDTTFDVGLGVTRLNVELRTIKQSGATDPDIYLKASGLDGVGALLGSPELDQGLDQLNGQWIAIDHTLLENIQSSVTQSQNSSLTPPSEADVMDELQAFGNVNKQYVFTTKKDKAVFTMVKKVGRETVGGHKTYHYKVAFNKANVKAYITAQRNALQSSKLGAWLKQNGYESMITDSYNSMEQSADRIKSSDTFDLWSDINTRVIYKVRFPGTTNPAENYTDFGLDYKGGNTFPIFLSGQSKDGSDTSSGNLTATINSDTNSVALNVDLKSTGSDPFSLSGTFTFKPSNTAVSVSAPQGAIPLSQVLDEFGLGGLLDGMSQGGSAALQTGTPDSAGISL